MFHVKLRIFGHNEFVPVPCYVNGIVRTHGYWNVDLNCHETPPITSDEYAEWYRGLGPRWLVWPVAGEIPAKPEPAKVDVTPEPSAEAEPTDADTVPNEGETPQLTYRQLRALAKERGIAVPHNLPIAELRVLVETPVAETA